MSRPSLFDDKCFVCNKVLNEAPDYEGEIVYNNWYCDKCNPEKKKPEPPKAAPSMYKDVRQVEEMIHQHISEINDTLENVKSHMNYGFMEYTELYKAKSMALNALATLKKG